jgi:phosphoribosylformylglycinamidine synthase
MEIFDLWDVPATVVGKVIKEKIVRLYYDGVQVFELDLDFLTKGPEYCRPTKVVKPPAIGNTIAPKLPNDINKVLLALLSDPNIASKEWVIRQYDHEVRGSTVTKPLQGKIGSRSHGDASVIKPLRDTYRGLAIAIGVNPWFTALHPYRGGLSAVDEMCRNLTAVGAVPHSLTDCLNFGNPEKPERLGEFGEAVKGIGDAAKALRIGAPSGNVSFYNETPKGAALPTPTVMGVGIVEDIRHCITSDFKKEGDPVYLVGETRNEMGGSALLRRFGGKGGTVPDVELRKMSSSMRSLKRSMDKGMVRACHDPSDGGVAVALAEMCIGGDIGFVGDVSSLGKLPLTVKLFSESNSRWVVEVESGKEKEWLRSLKGFATKIGEVEGRTLTVDDHAGAIDLDVDDIRKTWSEPFWRLLV